MIKIKYMDYNTILNLTVQQYNCVNFRKSKSLGVHGDKKKLHKLCVNYIRHTLSNYDDLPYSPELKVDVLKAIAEKYPLFKEACDEQIPQSSKG